MNFYQTVIKASEYIGLIMLILILLAVIFQLFEKKCPKCGGKMMNYDDNPEHDFCENGC